MSTPVNVDQSPQPLNQSSPQAKWASKMQAQGKCRCCGQPRPLNEDGTFALKQHCRSCQDKVNTYHNSYNKAKRDAKKAVVQAVSQPEGVCQGDEEQANVDSQNS